MKGKAAMRAPTITDQDMRRLADVIDLYEEVDASGASSLENALRKAIVVSPAKVAATVVTMNSQLVGRDERGRRVELVVVYPWHADPAEGRVSVLSPLGRALLGASVGDTVPIEADASDEGRAKRRTFTLEALRYQPESAGDYHL
ncbi:Regulator of nucleoside diphosphate kinase [Labilithrix luteola]|uniref:Regulator of nucleoside diphosphate kinase n=1 Tax=Labilithrix luteola TaxID=1391654 RepID=A0A0K1QC84_9BACT|nr:GreA/GreB family elongation factor [Labilithrix luteola]AKV03359.1 Regulator of nucleoside diphosphate kinase [Labilithrix luteola]